MVLGTRKTNINRNHKVRLLKPYRKPKMYQIDKLGLNNYNSLSSKEEVQLTTNKISLELTITTAMEEIMKINLIM